MSSGTTPILGLHTYNNLDDMDYNEVTADNVQIDTLPPTACLSSARPSTNLYTGRIIWETDTKRLQMWNGTTWKLISTNSDDTGWVNCTVRATFAAMAGSESPKVRRIGNVVWAKGGFLNTGTAINNNYLVGDLPAAVGGVSFAPPENDIRAAGTSAGNATADFFVRQDNILELRTGAILSGYFKLDRSWLID